MRIMYSVKLSPEELEEIRDFFNEKPFSIQEMKLPFKTSSYVVSYVDGDEKINFMRCSKGSISVYEQRFRTFPLKVKNMVKDRLVELNYLNDEIGGLGRIIRDLDGLN